MNTSNASNPLAQLVGVSPFAQRLREIVTQVAKTDATVLLYGESGTEKDAIAMAIHRLSTRNDKPFNTLNCSLVSENKLELELFGHEDKIPTDKILITPGQLELANKGTVFLDEIADLSLELQRKLLRIMCEHRFERLSGTQSLDIDLRLIVATEQNLQDLVQQGQFRKDLFYRLNVFPIQIEPLKNRKEDIPYLLDYFIKEIGEHLNKTISLSESARKVLTNYAWPGNLTELANFIEQMLILYPNTMLDVDKIEQQYASNRLFPESDLAFSKQPYDLKNYLENTEIKLINKALQENRGNVSRTAKHLLVGRTTLIEKMKRLGIRPHTNDPI